MRNKVTGKKLLTVSAGLFLGVIFLYLSWYSLGHLSMIFNAKWQNFCIRKILMPALV